jgi:glycerophosphoryl diester phosphodiesterase
MKEMFVIAHRGGGDLFPENTLKAFLGAEKLGCNAVECDVHLSLDGSLIVNHDADLNRVAGLNKKISDMKLQDILAIKLKNGEKIPILEDVYKSISIPVIVELKDVNTVKAMIKLFKDKPEIIKRTIVISFYHEILLEIKKHIPSLESGALLAGFPVDPVTVARSCKSNTLSLYFEGINRSYVDLCHKGGINVSVWTPNSEEEIRNCINAGVDSIGTDRPDLVLKLLNETSK